MAKTNGSNPKPRAADSSDEAPESLDKVRDILFGGQMRTVETRLRTMEERLQREQQSLRAEMARQLAEAEGSLRKEVAALTDKLGAERTKRIEDLKTLAAEVREGFKGLEKRHAKLEDATALSDAELRDQVSKASAALTAELGRLGERIGAELDRSVSELKNEKLDTAAFVTALSEVAAKAAQPSGRGGKGHARG